MNRTIALVQQQLKNQELPWQALLDSAGEGIWGVDLAGDCTFVNRAALLMIGYTSEELVGHNMHDMLHHHYPDGREYPKEECVINDQQREARDTVFVESSSAGTVRLAELLLNAGCSWNTVRKFELEGEAGFRGVAPLAVAPFQKGG